MPIYRQRAALTGISSKIAFKAINEYGKPTAEAYFRAEIDPADKAVLDANPNLYRMTGLYIIVQQQIRP